MPQKNISPSGQARDALEHEVADKLFKALLLFDEELEDDYVEDYNPILDSSRTVRFPCLQDLLLNNQPWEGEDREIFAADARIEIIKQTAQVCETEILKPLEVNYNLGSLLAASLGAKSANRYSITSRGDFSGNGMSDFSVKWIANVFGEYELHLRCTEKFGYKFEEKARNVSLHIGKQSWHGDEENPNCGFEVRASRPLDGGLRISLIVSNSVLPTIEDLNTQEAPWRSWQLGVVLTRGRLVLSFN